MYSGRPIGMRAGSERVVYGFSGPFKFRTLTGTEACGLTLSLRGLQTS